MLLSPWSSDTDGVTRGPRHMRTPRDDPSSQWCNGPTPRSACAEPPKNGYLGACMAPSSLEKGAEGTPKNQSPAPLLPSVPLREASQGYRSPQKLPPPTPSPHSHGSGRSPRLALQGHVRPSHPVQAGGRSRAPDCWPPEGVPGGTCGWEGAGQHLESWSGWFGLGGRWRQPVCWGRWQGWGHPGRCYQLSHELFTSQQGLRAAAQSPEEHALARVVGQVARPCRGR